MDPVGSGSLVLPHGGPGAAAGSAVALSSIKPGVAERLNVRKHMLTDIDQNGLRALIDGAVPDDMLQYTHAGVDELYPELPEGATAADRDRRDTRRREHIITSAKGAALYRQVFEKKQRLAESIVVRVLEPHNASKLRQMRAANKLYGPGTIGADSQTIAGAALLDRYDGIAMLKALLTDLGQPADTKDIQAHQELLHLMHKNPMPSNCTEAEFVGRCETATEKHNILLPDGKRMDGLEISRFIVEQMPVKMLQRQQLLYEMDHGVNRLRFADPDATLRECAAMVGYVFDPTAERAVLGVFEVVGAVSTYTLPTASASRTPPAPSMTEDRGRKQPPSMQKRKGDPRALEVRPDGSGAWRSRTFDDQKQRCKTGTCRFDHGERPCYANPNERIKLSFEMRDATFKRLLEQRLENGRRMQCTVEPFINGVRRSAVGGVSEDGLTVWPACGVCLDIQGRDYDQS